MKRRETPENIPRDDPVAALAGGGTPRLQAHQPRERTEAAFDRATAALTRARAIIVAAVRIAVDLPDFDPETHRAVVEIDKALADIATLRGEGVR